jgi:hypothetical protein
MISKICLIIGSLIVGYLLPVWFLLFSTKDVKIPALHNRFSGLGVGLIVTGLLFL